MTRKLIESLQLENAPNIDVTYFPSEDNASN